MSFNQISFGTPKRDESPSISVRPPTESGNHASALTDLRCDSKPKLGSGTTHDWLIPSGRTAGDGILVFVNLRHATIVSVPSGYTLLASSSLSNECYVYWKISDGTETDTSFTSSGTTDVAFVSGRIPANGATLSTPEFNEGITSILSTTSVDPPAVTPAAAGTYHVISALLMNTGDPIPDAEGAVSTGYTHMIECVSAVDTLKSHIVVQQKSSVDIVTTEDPGAYGWDTPGSSRHFWGITIAVAVASADPSVAPYDHDHVEADVTDLAHWDESDHDALDHTGLTGVGSDSDAIHDNVSGEIAAVTEKATPVDADLVLIEDSAASNVKKRVQLGNLPGGGGTSDHGALTGLADDDHTQYLLAAGTRAATYLEVSGLTGATGSSPRFVGGTTTGAPASGTFALGDYVVTEDGNIYVCTTAGSPGTWTAVGASAATDSAAIHDNVASEISAITAKATPTTSDFLLIEDAAASNAKKRITIGDLPSSGSGSSTGIAEHADDGNHSGAAFFRGFGDAETEDSTTVEDTSPNITKTKQYGKLSIYHPGGDAAAELHGVMWSYAPAGDFWIEAGWRWTNTTSNYHMVGLIAADGATYGAGNQTFIRFSNNIAPDYLLSDFTNYSSQAAGASGAPDLDKDDNWVTPLLYALLHYTSSTGVWDAAFSFDGISWIKNSGSTLTNSITTSHVGFAVTTWGGSQPMVMSPEYIAAYTGTPTYPGWS